MSDRYFSPITIKGHKAELHQSLAWMGHREWINRNEFGFIGTYWCDRCSLPIDKPDWPCSCWNCGGDVFERQEWDMDLKARRRYRLTFRKVAA